MENREANPSKTETMTVRMSPEVSDGLEALAHDTNRSKTYLAGAAIADFVRRNAWQVAAIGQALEEARAGAPGIPHQAMVDWMNSWGTDRELPPPEPRS